DKLPRTHRTPCPFPSTAGSAPLSLAPQLPLPSSLLTCTTSRPPNPVVGSGWPGRGAGVRTALSPGGRHRCNTLNSRGGTGSCLESPLVRCLIAPTGNRSIDPSTDPCSHSGFEVPHRILHEVDLYYAPAYKATVPKNPITD